MFIQNKEIRAPVQRPVGQYRIGITDLTLNSLWNPEAEKYKALCRMVHVTKAALHISYIQMTVNFVLLIFCSYFYMMVYFRYKIIMENIFRLLQEIFHPIIGPTNIMPFTYLFVSF